MGWGLVAAAGSVPGMQTARLRSELCLWLLGNRAPDTVPEFRGSHARARVCVCVCVCVYTCLCASVQRACVSACAHGRVHALCPCFGVHSRLWPGSSPSGSPVPPPHPPACCCSKHSPSPLPGGRDPSWAQVRGWFLSPKSQGVFFFFFFKSHTKREALKSTAQTPRIPSFWWAHTRDCPAMPAVENPVSRSPEA